MQKSDIRAVENPIGAIFDLAADAYERAPRVLKLVTYSRAFIYLWLFIDFFILIFLSKSPVVALLMAVAVSASLYSVRWADDRGTRTVLLVLAAVLSVLLTLFSIGPLFLLAALLVLLYFLGWIILDLLRDLRKFFDYYVVRHRAIRAVRDADPAVKVPSGPDSVSRLLTYLQSTSRETAHVMSQQNAVRRPVSIRGKSGVSHEFDAMVLAAPSSLWSLIGWAYPGWCILVKRYDNPPKLDDLKYLKHAAEDSLASLKVPPSRVIALWTMNEGQRLSEDAYQFLTSQVVTFTHHGDTFLCSLEMIAEDVDGTYDLVPFIAEVSL